jgi:hypothetical protein
VNTHLALSPPEHVVFFCAKQAVVELGAALIASDYLPILLLVLEGPLLSQILRELTILLSGFAIKLVKVLTIQVLVVVDNTSLVVILTLSRFLEQELAYSGRFKRFVSFSEKHVSELPLVCHGNLSL